MTQWEPDAAPVRPVRVALRATTLVKLVAVGCIAIPAAVAYYDWHARRELGAALAASAVPGLIRQERASRAGESNGRPFVLLRATVPPC